MITKIARWPLTLAVTLALVSLSSCQKGKGHKSDSASPNGAVSPPTPPPSTSSSKVSSTQDVVLTPPADDESAGTEVKFPAGSVSIDTEVHVEAGMTLATPATLAALGATKDNEVSSASASVAVLADDPSAEAVAPFSINLKLTGDGAALTADDTLPNLIVIYQAVVNGAPVFGTIPRTDLTVENGNVTVTTTHFGVYQAALVKVPSAISSTPVPAGPIVTRKESAKTPISVGQLSPAAFTPGTTVEVTGANFRESVNVTVGGVQAQGVIIKSDKLLTFIVPAGVPGGNVDVILDQDGGKGLVQGIVKDGKTEPPAASVDPKRLVADADRALWTTAASWGDHRLAGYLKDSGPGRISTLLLLSHNGIDSDAKPTSLILAAPNNMTTNQTYTLPLLPGGAGKYLTSDTAGVMSWQALPSGGGSLSVPGPIGATTPDSARFTAVSLDGSAARVLEVERNAAATAGGNLTIGAGGARGGDTNGAGGKLVLASGIATGSGASTIELQTAGGGSGGSADQAPTTKVTILGNGKVGIGTTAPGQKLTVDGTFGILETGATPTFHTIFQGGDQSGDVTYSLPTAAPSLNGQVLSSQTDGTMSWMTPTSNSGTVTSVNVTAPAAGLTVSGGPVSTSGSITLALANDLAALEGLATTGFAKRTGTDTWSTVSSIALSSDVGGTLPVTNGGTGLTALGTANQLLGTDGTGAQYKTLSGTANQIAITNAGSTMTFSTPQNIGTGSSPSFFGLTVSGLTDGVAHVTSGSIAGGKVNLASTSDVTGIAAPGNGGTGLSTAPTAGSLLIGNSSSGYTSAALTPGTGISITNGNGSITINATGDTSRVAKAGDTMTGQLLGFGGAVGSPGFSFGGDTDTGLWSSGADTLNFSTAGAERMRLTGTGNVAIGTTAANSPLQVAGAIATDIANKTGGYTLLASNSVVTADASGGAFTIAVPTAAGITGRRYTIKKTDSSPNVVTVDPAGAETIDGSSTYGLARQYQSVSIISNGANWIADTESTTSPSTLTGTETLTNKTLNSTDTISGATASSFTNGAQTIILPTSADTLVGRATTDTLSNKTLTAPVIATISNSGTLTLPTGPETIVGRDTTDTLTNKTLTAPIIATISNGGTLTLPSGPDTLVGRATTDTLSNKTLAGAFASTLTGGNATSSTLTLTSTSNGSPSGAYLILNGGGQGNVGINTLFPGQTLTVDGTIGILEGGGSPVYHTTFQGGDQSANITYTLPTAAPGVSGQVLAATTAGVMSWTPGMTWDATKGMLSIAGSGAQNLFVGVAAGNSRTTASSDTYLGYNAGSLTTSGSNDTMLGARAGEANVTGAQNTFVGALAGVSSTGNENTLVGAGSGSGLSTGDGNTLLGSAAGSTDTTGSNNTMIGYYVGLGNLVGWANTFVGAHAGAAANSDNNTFVGYYAGMTVTSGQHDVAIGSGADFGATTNYSTAIGEGATATGDFSMAIGRNVTVATANSIALGYNGSTRMFIDSSGNTGFGTTTPSSLLHVNGPIATAYQARTYGNYNITAADSILDVDATGGATTLTLPTASGIAGRQYTIIKSDSSTSVVYVAPPFGTIQGLASVPLWMQYQTVKLISDGTNWRTVDSAPKVLAAKISNNGSTTCTPSSPIGNWISSVAYSGTGICTITPISALAGSTIVCTCSVEGAAAAGYMCNLVGSPSASTVAVQAMSATSAAIGAKTVDVQCVVK